VRSELAAVEAALAGWMRAGTGSARSAEGDRRGPLEAMPAARFCVADQARRRRTRGCAAPTEGTPSIRARLTMRFGPGGRARATLSQDDR